MHRRSGLVVAFVAFVATAILVSGRAGAEDPPGGGIPPPQKKIDHPYATYVLGTWEFTGGTGKGTTTIRLSLDGTALIEDLEASMGPAPYAGHGVRKISDDGKTMTVWWFDNFSPEPEVFTGMLTADGYDLKSAKRRITAKKTATGLEFKMFEGETPLFTSQYSKKK